MNLLRFASAAILATGFALSPATAAPIVSPGSQPSGQNLAMPVHYCHSDVRRAYIPQFGRTATHRHQRDCRPVRVDNGGSRDCHRNARRHFVPGYGQVVHRHVGSNCRVRILRRYDGPGGRECVRIGPIRYCVIAGGGGDEPRFCTKEYRPVCARRDGRLRTFGNACEADAAGWRVVSRGEC
jgi:hypothetical protein